MSMSDPISDLLTRIRNAQARGKPDVCLPSSNKKIAILKVCEEEGYIDGYRIEGTEKKPVLRVMLKYYNNKPVFELIKRISRPGLRSYKKHNELPRVMDGFGVAIVTTSKGVMSDRAARALGLGGEILCFIA